MSDETQDRAGHALGEVAVAPAHTPLGDEYVAREQTFDEPSATSRVYAKQSRTLLRQVQQAWNEYCRLTRKDPMKHLHDFSIAVLFNFFHWLLRTRQKTLRHASTLQTYYNTLCLVRKRQTGSYVCPQDIKEKMVGVRQQLGREFKLETEKKPKPIIRAEDEFHLLQTLWSSAALTMNHERLRVQLALIVQLAGITGNRPGALLAVRYRHLKVTLLPDPHRGCLPRVLIEVTFKSTKTYRGPKDPNTFPIPEICSDSCLPLCPQIALLGLMFADGAFAAERLTGPDELYRLKVPAHLNQLVLPVKESMHDTPVFRAVTPTVNGYAISQDEPANCDWLRQQLKRWGDATGFELPVGPYGFRRGNGEALDSAAWISDAQRNIILQHATSRVFESSYLSRYITQDAQAAYRGLAPQTAIIKAASGMTRSIDRRQPTCLSREQLDQVDQHPDLQQLTSTRKSLAQQIHAAYGTLACAKDTDLHQRLVSVRKKYEARRKALQRACLSQVKVTFRKTQVLADIEQQLNETCAEQGEASAAEIAQSVRQPSELSVKRQAALLALFAGESEDPSLERQRRSAAIRAISQLCHHQEPHRRQVCLPHHSPPCAVSRDHAAPIVLVEAFPMRCLPTQCIFCLGNISLDMSARRRCFWDSYTLGRHFMRNHLRYLRDNIPINCPHPRCTSRLEHKSHLRRHALEEHGTRT